MTTDPAPATSQQVIPVLGEAAADGTQFSMIKFRSLMVGDDDASGPLFERRHGPGVTRVGVLLRKYSFDELPQLLNVLAGSMSLVGPGHHCRTKSPATPATPSASCWSSPG